MSDGMGREPTYLSSHVTNRYFIPNWGKYIFSANVRKKPAVCSKFRESTKAIGNIKSVSPLSPNGLIVFF